MDLFGLPILTVLRERMHWLSARQTVLSENVANANSPGYTARDLKPLDFEALLSGGNDSGAAIALTNPAHLRPAAPAGDFEAVAAPDSSTSTTGNSVVLEDQMIKVSQTQMDYEAVVNLYKKALGLIRIALGNRG